MSFDAGSIKGSLDLDTTSFKKGFSEAHTHAETEGGRIREVLESLTSVLSSALGPAVGELGEKLQSVFAGFSEGPLIGSLNAVATAVGFVREAVIDSAAEFHRLGLEAQKAGISVEFLDRLVNVGNSVGVGIDQLSNGFKVLEQQIEGAADGSNKKAAEGFEALGISIHEAGELSKDPERLFSVLQDRLGSLTDAAHRTTVVKEVLGRAGYNLIPIFTMGRQEFDKFADTLDRLSGGVNVNAVKMSDDFARLQAMIQAAMDGIAREVAKPILEEFSKKSEDATEKLEKAVDHLTQHLSGTGFAGSQQAGKPANTINNYNVQLTAQLDHRQTAAALVQQILPALQKMQKDHDQKAAGDMAAAAVASGMGGGS